MIDLRDKSTCPTLEEIGQYVRNPVFMQFCLELKEAYQCSENIAFSACSMERGWNVKFKKSGKALCTFYPREDFMTVLVVVGRSEKERVEAVLPECTAQLQEEYRQTREWNGQRWLMIDLGDNGALYRDVLRLIQIRRSSARPPR